MRIFLLGLASIFALSGCGEHEAHAFPASAQRQFERTCPPNSETCRCTWDRITRTLSYEDYQAALDRYATEGLMDPRITRARTHCIEHHRA